MSNVIITGASSGLGLAIALELQVNHAIINLDKVKTNSANARFDTVITDLANDILLPHQARKAASLLPEGRVDILINCAGINGIDYLEDLHHEQFKHLMAVNATAPFILAKALLPQLADSCGTILNIISNASHMPMTSSLAYNASKGALHIMTLQMARELTKRHSITVFGISPNKLRGTGMSHYIEERVLEVRGWTREYAEQYQKNALLAGEETDPLELACFVKYLLFRKCRHKFLTGCVIPYGA